MIPSGSAIPAHAVTDQSIVQEMETSYLDYAMSVIVARALPDVRDGLKPVHRRILYAMWRLGLRPGARFSKSAKVVGEVLGKYHPHSDTAVYDSMVRMAQDFAMRYRLVNGQGNFGSMDGDNAAAMRYTEAKLMGIAEELLSDIDKNTVNFVPNYDNSEKEPEVLPALLPNLLLNGGTGIAVGMATDIPPHNLRELVGAVQHLLKHPDATVNDLMEFVKGPDFPTGGVIYDIKEITAAYATGKGRIVMRGEAEIVENRSGQYQIIITSIPYQVNKATMVEKMADLVREKKVEGIKDLRDESNKAGVRVVIDLKKDAYPKKILNNLYKHTQLQDSFHVNMVALVDSIQPRVLTLKTALEEYIKYRKEVVRRRAQYDLDRAQERAHILEGLHLALNKIDAVIKVIKASKDREIAKVNLIKQFKLSERQSVAILEMRLQALANLERLKIETELAEKRKLIGELTALLKSPQKITGIITDELAQLVEKYGDDRKTKVIKSAVGEMSAEDLIPNESAVVTITHDGYIKRMSPDMFKAQGRGGKGVMGMTTKEEDDVEHFFSTNTHSDLMFFTTRGRVFQLKTYEIPQASRTAKGQNIVNFLQLGPEEKVSSVLPGEDLTAFKYFVMVTKKGLIKKVDIAKFVKVRRSGLIALKLKGEDTLEWVRLSSGNDDVVLISRAGQAIRFKEKLLRPMGRNAVGVRGMRLKKEDTIIGMDLVVDGKASPSEQLLTVMDNGFGKRTKLTEYKSQGRGGSGVKTAHVTAKTGAIASAMIVDSKREKEDLIIISSKGQVIRLPLGTVNVTGRATQGVRLMRFKDPKDSVANVILI
ncbi:MAG: DNA gyrase subunit A [Candidatus Komeilibacteria bacterium RIFCSPLOWO2_01_FULL_53_11]|uniref:DNA gyrase subunit A n=1 Tax=Candidatus Komeilibacteria bacterium RIFCSPLOWO2_01_FULL_53_11 TaxID=1798552 RepID=A0A1G2BVE3_9BACT|nr:MAG: DNA gyrase subunit A [Candidatus Komeilibacteria bacterium RIFCSPLOWO2_01_FULL_53_11]